MARPAVRRVKPDRQAQGSGYAAEAVRAIRRALSDADMAHCRWCRRPYLEAAGWEGRTTSCGLVSCRMAEAAASERDAADA